jgi:hypothetical protein
MEEILFNAFDILFKDYDQYGYYNEKDVMKVLAVIAIRDMMLNDTEGFLEDCDIRIIERNVYKLLGESCILPLRVNDKKCCQTGDIFIDPSYPLYFGIGFKRFVERVKEAGAQWFAELRNLMKLAVISISIQGIDIPKDMNGNVDLSVPTLNEFIQAYNKLLGFIKDDNDKLYNTTYNAGTKTLTINPKPTNTEPYKE